MARTAQIGDLQTQIPVEEGLRRVIPERSGASIGPALENLGGATERVAQSEATGYAMSALSAAQSDWHKKLTDAQTAAPAGAPNFTAQIMTDYGKYVDQTVKGAPSGLAGKFLQQRLQDLGSQISQRAVTFEATERQRNYTEIAKQSVDSAGNELMDSPELFPTRLAERRELISHMNLDADVKQKLNDYATSTMAKYATMGAISRDPYAASLELNSATPQNLYTKVLSPEMRESLMDHADRTLHQRVADAERIEQLQGKQDEATREQIMRDGILRSSKGQLSAGWVNSQRELLKPQEYEHLLDMAAGKDKEVKSDLPTYSGLLTRQTNGEDVRDEANTAFTRKLLSEPDYTRLMTSSAKELPNWYKQGHEFIQTAGQVSQLEPDPAKAQTLANMQNEWTDWAQAHSTDPKVTAQDAEKQFRSIVTRYQLVKADQSQLGLVPPQYLVGTRGAPDMAATKKATRDAFDRHEIGQDELDKQIDLLRQWQAVTDASAKRKAAAAKSSD